MLVENYDDDTNVNGDDDHDLGGLQPPGVGGDVVQSDVWKGRGGGDPLVRQGQSHRRKNPITKKKHKSWNKKKERIRNERKKNGTEKVGGSISLAHWQPAS